MRAVDRVINLILSGVLILGVYQIYFWCQRNALVRPREFAVTLDDKIPYSPWWVWIYSFLYYPVILYVNATFRSAEEFTRIAASYLLLLVLQAGFFLLLPVRTPLHWRTAHPGRTLSERVLKFVQRIDAPTNSFPSMHTSVAMLTALHLRAELGAAAFAFPVLIGASCLLTKQHYLADVPAGAGLGWLAHTAYLQYAGT